MIAVSNEIHEDLEWAHFGRGKMDPGLVLDVEEARMKLYVRTWGQLIAGCRSRMRFIQERLGAAVTSDSGLAHLKRLYAEYMPVVAKEEKKGRKTGPLTAAP